MTEKDIEEFESELIKKIQVLKRDPQEFAPQIRALEWVRTQFEFYIKDNQNSNNSEKR